MNLIPPEHVRSLRNDVSVIELIRTLGIETDKRGSRFTFRCPICQSFATATHERTNLARCFACATNFNTIDLVLKAHPDWSFRNVVAYLERFVGH